MRSLLTYETETALATQSALEAFGAELARRRSEMDISGAKLGEKLGVSQGKLTAIENAYRRKGQESAQTPDDEFLESVSEVMGWPLLKIHALLGRLPMEYAVTCLRLEQIGFFKLTMDEQGDALSLVGTFVDGRMARRS